MLDRATSRPRLGDDHPPLHGRVVAELRQAILSGQLKPGERLVEEGAVGGDELGERHGGLVDDVVLEGGSVGGPCGVLPESEEYGDRERDEGEEVAAPVAGFEELGHAPSVVGVATRSGGLYGWWFRPR